MQLTVAAQGNSVPYLDLTLTAKVQRAPERYGLLIAQVQTTLYDKCLHGPLAGLPIIKYPHIISGLSWECKYNIVNSQFTRLVGILTEQNDFAQQMAGMFVRMVRRGYQLQLLLLRLQQLLQRHPYHWQAAWHGIMFEVMHFIAAMKLDAEFPGLGDVMREHRRLMLQ